MKKISKVCDLLFYLGYFLVVFSDMFDNVAWLEDSLIIIDVASILVLSLSFFCGVHVDRKRISKFGFLGLVGFTLLVAITAVVADSRTLVKLPFLFIAFIGMSFRDVASFDVKARSLLLLIMISLTMAGLNGDTVLEYRYGLMRNSFGLGHPNAFAFEFSVIYAELLYLSTSSSKKTINLLVLLGGVAILIFNYFFIGSRTNMVLIVLLMMAYFMRNFVKNNQRLILFILKNFFWICLLISFTGILIYKTNTDAGLFLDELLSKRLSYEEYAIGEYGISLFGHVMVRDVMLDNAYLNMMVRYGVVLLVYLGLMYNMALKKLIRSKQIALVLLFVMFMFYGLSETPMYSPGKNSFVLLLAYSFVPVKTISYLEKGYKDE